MWFVIEVLGCLPNVALVTDEESSPLAFETKDEATAYAEENCGWEYGLVEF